MRAMRSGAVTTRVRGGSRRMVSWMASMGPPWDRKDQASSPGQREGTSDRRPPSGRGFAAAAGAAAGAASRGRREYGERPPVEEKPSLHPGLAPKPNEPATPEGLDLRKLPRGVRAELRSLTTEHADVVGAHLLMAGMLIDSDPELAYAHAEAARRRAARLPVTREATGETAYAAGHFDVALSEFRALRRMSGTTEYLPAIADCERALGRPQAALKVVKEGLAAQPDAHQSIELRLVEAGARVDLGQRDEAIRLLRAELEHIGSRGPKLARARLRYGYAELLVAEGDLEEAEKWFNAAAALDTETETDAADRVAELQGVTIVFDESEDLVEPGDESLAVDVTVDASEPGDKALAVDVTVDATEPGDEELAADVTADAEGGESGTDG